MSIVCPPSLVTVTLDADCKVRLRGIALAPNVQSAARDIQQDSYRRSWKLGGALIVNATLDPSDIIERLTDVLLMPATRGMGALMTDQEFDLWRHPQPPARLTGGVGRTRPEPF